MYPVERQSLLVTERRACRGEPSTVHEAHAEVGSPLAIHLARLPLVGVTSTCKLDTLRRRRQQKFRRSTTFYALILVDRHVNLPLGSHSFTTPLGRPGADDSELPALKQEVIYDVNKRVDPVRAFCMRRLPLHHLFLEFLEAA